LRICDQVDIALGMGAGLVVHILKKKILSFEKKKFSKVISIGTLHSTYTRALIFFFGISARRCAHFVCGIYVFSNVL
jgi:hypothetical protein